MCNENRLPLIAMQHSDQHKIATPANWQLGDDAIVQKLKMIGEHRSGLFMLDRALGERKAGS